jgi:hypothetical protein
MQADAFGEDRTGRFAVLDSETRMSFPPVPPSPPPPPEKRYVAVIAVAIATGVLVVGSLMLFVGTSPGDAEPNADAVESDTAPSPTVVTTPSVGTSPNPVNDHGRISAIVADAHSGKYFANTFEDSYPKGAEIALVTGMAGTTEGDPTVSDELLACSLSYIETHIPLTELLKKDQKSAERLGVKAGIACLDYMNL